MLAICSWCGTDEYVVAHDTADDIATCYGPGHVEPRMFQPKADAGAKRASRSSRLPDGIAAELSLYDDLPTLLVNGEWFETGLVEYLYATTHPKEYLWMLARRGHSSSGPRRYSTTIFIGSTLGNLSRATKVTYHEGTGTGFFAHNARVGYWTTEPVPTQSRDVSWAQFAATNDLDALRWPWVDRSSTTGP